MRLYRQIDVWSRLADSKLVRYRCFHILPDNLYCVQSEDFFYQPITEEQIVNSELQFHELLAGEAPEIRTAPAATLEEAIAQHREEFRDFAESVRPPE